MANGDRASTSSDASRKAQTEREARLDEQQRAEEKRRLEERMRETAAGFAKLFRKHVWKPFAADGYPAARWPVVREAFERLWPLASTAVDAAFATAIEGKLAEEMRSLEAEARGRR